MADLQLPEGGPSNIGPPPPSQPPFPAATTAIPTSTDNLGGQTLAPKRQRRPSVRLGEIGDQPATLSYETHLRRNNKIWRLPKDSSKTRPLTNLVTNGVFHETLDADGNNTIHEFTNRRAKEPKAKRASVKRVRSNWVYSKTDEFGEGVEKFGSKEDGDNGCSELEPEGSDNDLKYQSPDHSVENLGQDLYRRPIRARVSHSGEHDGIELDGMPESNSRDQKYDTSADGIRNWLIGLGLGRYAPVFEIHEVDDEVLPLLTLEDLKDMGVNAVGSRRKMYAAIQKLRKGFS